MKILLISFCWIVFQFSSNAQQMAEANRVKTIPGNFTYFKPDGLGNIFALTQKGDYGRVLIHQPKTKLDLTKEVETTSFAFDNAFDEDSNNIDIYEQAVQGLIPGLFRGKWASVFAYGQTGSGKTVREICHELQCIA